MKSIVLRFDIDTHPCVAHGVPLLLDLAKRCDVPMTFYINMGRAVDIRAAISRRVRDTSTGSPAVVKKKIIEKLGFSGWLTALLINPKVGASKPDVLRRIVDEGHELGLHGGRNHGTWQAYAYEWEDHQLRNEVNWGIEQMRNAGLPEPRSFASPGWVSPSRLPSLLDELGFSLLADAHNTEAPACCDVKHPVRTVNTNLLGEPGGVGWFESLDARGIGEYDTFLMVLESLNRHGSAMLYDHPCYMAKKIESTCRLIKNLKSEDVKFLTAAAMAEQGGVV